VYTIRYYYKNDNTVAYAILGDEEKLGRFEYRVKHSPQSAAHHRCVGCAYVDKAKSEKQKQITTLFKHYAFKSPTPRLTLSVVCGHSGIGKSWLCRHFSKSADWVCQDSFDGHTAEFATYLASLKGVIIAELTNSYTHAIRRLSKYGVRFYLVHIDEPIDVINERRAMRGGKPFTLHSKVEKRLKRIKKYAWFTGPVKECITRIADVLDVAPNCIDVNPRNISIKNTENAAALL